MLREETLQAFRGMVSRPQEGIDLARAALLIAKTEYPDLESEGYIVRLDRMGRTVKRRLKGERNPYRAVGALNRYLFQEQGFRGDTENYYDPRNSYLNDVLDRKLGIPITLSVVYLEVARRVGLALTGVGMPGRFLVKYVDDHDEFFVDCFEGGRLLTLSDALERARRGPTSGEDGHHHLASVTRRQLLARMLQNLKGVYFNNGDYQRALEFVELLLAIYPWSATELRDRGMINYQLRSFGRALEDLETYVAVYPDAPDSDRVKRSIRMLRPLAERTE